MLLVADTTLDDLSLVRRRRVWRAGDGCSGGGEGRQGRRGDGVELRVPLGTRVLAVPPHTESAVGAVLAELLQDGACLVVARGGAGGSGNARFATAANREPRLAEVGEEGSRQLIKLEVWPLVDVAFVGLPNAGRSRLFARVTGAHVASASHPFTTTAPSQGAVELHYCRLMAVDLPSLVEGAHGGRGLGAAFLRTAARASTLVYILDGTRASPADDLLLLDREIALCEPNLARRCRVIVVNKLDLPEVAQRRHAIETELRTVAGVGRRVIFVSAAAGTGVPELVAALFAAHDAARRDTQPTAEAPPVVHPEPPAAPEAAIRSGDAFRIVHPRAVRIAAGSDLGDWAVRVQYHAQLARLGVTRRLEELGVRAGDTVMVGESEFEWR